MRFLVRCSLILSILFVACPYLSAAVAYDATTISFQCANTGSSCASFNHPIGGGVTNGAVAVLFSDASTSDLGNITLTVGGNTPTEVTGTSIGHFSGLALRIFCIATGSTTGNVAVVGSWDGGAAVVSIVAVSVSGADQTTPCNGGTNEDPGFNGAPSLAITSAASDLSFDITTNQNSVAASPTQTSRWSSGNGGTTDHTTGSTATTPAATVTHAWDGSHGFIIHSGANFKAAAAPPPAAGNGNLLLLQ